MQIRPATHDDVSAIVRLLATDRLGQSREQLSDPLPDEYWAAFEAIDADPNNVLLVGEEDGEVVATLQLTFLPGLTFQGSWRAQIEGVRVSDARRGRGLGRELIEWSIEAARRRGCRLVQLTSNKERSDALRFYEDLGFRATHEGFKLYLDGDVHGR